MLRYVWTMIWKLHFEIPCEINENYTFPSSLWEVWSVLFISIVSECKSWLIVKIIRVEISRLVNNNLHLILAEIPYWTWIFWIELVNNNNGAFISFSNSSSTLLFSKHYDFVCFIILPFTTVYFLYSHTIWLFIA